MVSALLGISFLGMIIVAFFSGRWVTGFVGVIAAILGFMALGSLGALIASALFIFIILKGK